MQTIVETNIHERDAYGCHITVQKIDTDQFHVTVSYPVYNDLGEQVASPEWGDVGTGEEMYLFILATVARAQNVNKRTLRINLPCLQAD